MSLTTFRNGVVWLAAATVLAILPTSGQRRREATR